MTNEELVKQFVQNRGKQPIQQPTQQTVSKPVEEDSSFFGTVKDVVKGVVRGPFENLKNTATNLYSYFGMEAPKEGAAPFSSSILKMIGEPSTEAGKIAESISQVGSAILTTRGAGGGFGASMVTGAAADFVIWDKDDGRLADLLSEQGIQNGLIEYLKHDPNDSRAADNFKHVIEGGLLGVAAEGVIRSTIASYKFAKAQLWAGRTAEDVAAILDGTTKQGKEPLKPITNKEDIVPKKKQTKVVEPVTKMEQKVSDTTIEDIAAAPNVKGDKPPETSFNYDRVQVDEESKKILEGITKNSDFEEYFKTGVKPQELTNTEADLLVAKMGDNYLDFATQLVKDTEDLDVKLVAIKKIMATKVQSIAERTKGVSPDDKVSLLKSLKDLQELYTLVGGAKAAQTSAARTTAAGRISVIPQKVFDMLEEVELYTPELLEKELDTFINSVQAAKIHKELSRFVDIEDEVNLHRVVEGLNTNDGIFTKAVNVLLETRTAGLLSSPVTTAINIIGNTSVMALRNVEYYMAGAIGKVTGAQDRFLFEELNAMSSGMFTSTKETFKNLGRTLKKIPEGAKEAEDFLEASYLDNFQKYDTGSYKAVSQDYILGRDINTPIKNFFGKSIDIAGAAIRLPYHALGITDDMFKRSIYQGQITYIATREANKRGLEGAAKQQYIGEFVTAHLSLYARKGQELSPEVKGLVQKHIVDNSAKFHSEAIERSREYVFQEELRAGERDSKINKTLHYIDKVRTASPYAQFIIPFYRTPVNILKWVGRRTPGVHLLSQRMMDDFAAGGRRKALAQSKLAMGTSLYALGGFLAYNGQTTGAAPANEREAWKTAGIPEYSIKIGNEWVQYNRFDPVGMFLGLTADLNQFHQDMARRGYDNLEGYQEKFDEVSAAVIVSFSNNVLNKTWVKGVSDVVKAIEYKDSGYFTSMTASIAPYSSAVRWANDTEYYKEAETLIEKFKKNYEPYTLRDALDIFGKPQEKHTQFGIVSGVGTDSLIRQEIMRLKLPVTKFDDKIIFKGTEVELEPEDHWKLQKLTDSVFNLEENLNKVVSTQAYKNAPDGIDFTVKGTKKWFINNKISEIREKSRKYFISRNENILNEYMKQRQINIDTLSNKNKGLYERWLNDGK